MCVCVCVCMCVCVFLNPSPFSPPPVSPLPPHQGRHSEELDCHVAGLHMKPKNIQNIIHCIYTFLVLSLDPAKLQLMDIQNTPL